MQRRPLALHQVACLAQRQRAMLLRDLTAKRSESKVEDLQPHLLPRTQKLTAIQGDENPRSEITPHRLGGWEATLRSHQLRVRTLFHALERTRMRVIPPVAAQTNTYLLRPLCKRLRTPDRLIRTRRDRYLPVPLPDITTSLLYQCQCHQVRRSTPSGGRRYREDMGTQAVARSPTRRRDPRTMGRAPYLPSSI